MDEIDDIQKRFDKSTNALEKEALGDQLSFGKLRMSQLTQPARKGAVPQAPSALAKSRTEEAGHERTIVKVDLGARCLGPTRTSSTRWTEKPGTFWGNCSYPAW